MIALDTHALVWWVADPKQVPLKARRLIDAEVAARRPLIVSSISIWEVVMLVTANRLSLTMDVAVWINHLEGVPLFRFVPVDNRIALRSVQLRDFVHRDPADRIIVATALSVDATLITADARLRRYEALNTAWD